jgi:hypothetical protein
MGPARGDGAVHTGDGLDHDRILDLDGFVEFRLGGFV